MFDSVLAEYATNHFARQGIHVHTQRTVTRIEDGILHLKEEDPVKFGMLVWSTGLDMTPLIKELKGVKKDHKAGKIMTDGYLRLLDSNSEANPPKVIPDVYAIGDCAVIEGDELPSTAQVASQEGAWLRRHLNRLAKYEAKANATRPAVQEMTAETASVDKDSQVGRGFIYHNILTLAYLGSWRAIAQRSAGLGIRGRVAWLLWRGAYMTKTISLRNKIRVPLLWQV